MDNETKIEEMDRDIHNLRNEVDTICKCLKVRFIRGKWESVLVKDDDLVLK